MALTQTIKSSFDTPDAEIPNSGQLNPYLIDRNYLKFYQSRSWRNLRQQVLAIDHNECVVCKSKGRYTKAVSVHHIFKIRERPDLALLIYVTDASGKVHRNLISVCDACHKTLDEKEKNKPLTEEWFG